jgi:hypothetical protein
MIYTTKAKTYIVQLLIYLFVQKDKFKELRAAYPGAKLLIVSNTAGTSSDIEYKEAALLEKNTGVSVLKHDTKVCVLTSLLFPSPFHNR